MKHTNSELRKQAREALDGNWGKGVVATIIIYAISMLVPVPLTIATDSPAVQCGMQLLWYLLTFPLVWGFMVFFLSILRKEDKLLSALFDGYKDYKRIMIAELMRYIFTFLWMLLLVVPGIIKALSYSMMDFILKDHPEISGQEAIHRSRVLMDGNKMKLFLLYLSFIGWALLCILTLGFGFLLLFPYVQASLAAFYQDLVNVEKEHIASAQSSETTSEPAGEPA